ncbi:hypothetical protein K2173_009373 [Erythroxylum novogranatense]|uniref:Secreted protein n=1 Tax=Erythroxylum novogranatense TaxID=1862640 RepID=A0AAV8U3R9_9ROSI|nr:hypothetical protein K2173_009373 [Erythroxylum novogranatense]
MAKLLLPPCSLCLLFFPQKDANFQLRSTLCFFPFVYLTAVAQFAQPSSERAFNFLEHVGQWDFISQKCID